MKSKHKKSQKIVGKMFFGKEEIKDILIIIGFIILDQLTKYFAVKHLTKSFPIIKNIFHFTLVKNTGIGFGLLRESNTLLIFLTIAILGLIIYYFRYLSDDRKYNIGISLVTAGALSNLIDRIVRHNIIDFIDFRIWPVFNIADSLILVGIVWLIIITLKQKD
ncbi:MAG: signal peptidase II [Nanoarchaeota archaeon]|nr:signal peptidase II [Nanoarchaeota archaeon]